MSAKLKYQICEATDTFVYGKIDLRQSVQLANKFLAASNKQGLEKGEIGSDDRGFDLESRNSDITWIKGLNKTKDTVNKLVKQINRDYFQIYYDEPEAFQYTTYNGQSTHYDWHKDMYKDDEDEFIRTLSLSICLSPIDCYLGGEFFIKDGCEQNVRVFKMGIGDFIVFPSDNDHKVNALRDGVRSSLVVWYGYEDY